MTIAPLILKPSRYLAIILLLIGLGGVISIWFLPIFYLAQFFIYLGVMAMTWDALSKHALRKSANTWLCVRLQQQQIMLFNDQQQRTIRLHADSVVTLHFVLLRYQFLNIHPPKWGRSWHHLIILSDACDADVFRQWRVWLLWGIVPEQIAQDD